MSKGFDIGILAKVKFFWEKLGLLNDKILVVQGYYSIDKRRKEEESWKLAHK